MVEEEEEEYVYGDRYNQFEGRRRKDHDDGGGGGDVVIPVWQESAGGDLDPQTNATVMLIGEDQWKDLNDKEHTLARLFQDALLEPTDRKFDLDKTLQRKVSNVVEVKKVDYYLRVWI